MILAEYLNNNALVRHYSDQNFLLLQNETGAKYIEAIDLVPCRYTYTETNEPIEENIEPAFEIEEKAVNTTQNV